MTTNTPDVDGPADNAAETIGQDKADNLPPDDNSLILGSIYQGLMARCNSLMIIRWQTLTLGLAAQGFIIGAASQVQKAQLTTAVMLAVVILFIGLATIVTGQRFELVALADRHMLGTYEERLLQGTNSDLRLHHALGGRARGAAMLRGSFLRKYQDGLDKRGPYWVLNKLARLGPNHCLLAVRDFCCGCGDSNTPLLRHVAPDPMPGDVQLILLARVCALMAWLPPWRCCCPTVQHRWRM